MPHRMRRILLFTVFAVMSVPSLVADEDPVILESIRTVITGKTRRNALLRELRLSEGMGFPNEEEMLRVAAFRIRNLRDRGLFKEFETEIRERAPGLYELDIRIVDAFTLYPAPIVAYSSDLGIIVGGTAAYQNAFGSMTDQIVMGFWSPAKTYIMARAGNIAAGPVTLEVTFEQEMGLNRFGSPTGDVVLRFDSMRTQASVLVDVPMGFDGSWSYWIEPIVSLLYNYELDYNLSRSLGDNQFFDRGLAPGFDHGVVFDGIAKEGNLRRGIRFDVMNTNLWYTGTRRSDVFLESYLTGLIPAADWLEFSGRIGGFYAAAGTRREAGDRLRGTLDYMTYGTAGSYLTGQVNFVMFQPPGGFELHIRPFADIGYVHSEEWNNGPDAFEYCVGSSLIFYIPALQSLSLNLDFGWDIKRRGLEVIVGFEPFI